MELRVSQPDSEAWHHWCQVFAFNNLSAWRPVSPGANSAVCVGKRSDGPSDAPYTDAPVGGLVSKGLTTEARSTRRKAGNAEQSTAKELSGKAGNQPVYFASLLLRG